VDWFAVLDMKVQILICVAVIVQGPALLAAILKWRNPSMGSDDIAQRTEHQGKIANIETLAAENKEIGIKSLERETQIISTLGILLDRLQR